MEISSWNDAWFEAHSLFVYETFLYIVAALLKTNAYKILHEIFTSHYLLAKTERSSDYKFVTFDCFYGYSDTLQKELAPNGKRLYSPAAELIKRQADRDDLPFEAIIEAEQLIFLMSLLTPDVRWYPQTLHYSSFNVDFPFFVRATQHKHFLKLATITGVNDANQLRQLTKQGIERLNVKGWHDFYGHSFWTDMNMEKLDSLK